MTEYLFTRQNGDFWIENITCARASPFRAEKDARDFWYGLMEFHFNSGEPATFTELERELHAEG